MTIDIGVTAQQLLKDDRPLIRGGEVEFTTIGSDPVRIHTFTSSEEIIVEKDGIVDVLIVAGGGGGGSDNGGGGGAGGVVYRKGYSQLETGTYSVVVGAGGAGAPASAGQTSGDPASNGTNSEIIFIPENYTDYSGSVVLDGSSGYLISADNTALRIGTNDFTVEAWINVNDYNLNNSIASKSGATTAEGWFFATASNAALTRRVLTESNTQPKTLEFKDDGTAFYTVENNTVYQYDMSTAWDLSTAQQKPQWSVNPPESAPRGTFFRADGEKFYLIGNTGDRVSQFMLRTPWSIKTAVLENSSTVIPDTVPYAVQFSPDGLNMFVLGRTNNRIFYYTLSIAWDVTTAVNTTQFLSLAAITTVPGDFYFRPDGFRIYVLSDLVPFRVYRYNLSTAWDISTATLSTDIRDIETETSPTAIRFKPDGTIMYIMGSASDSVLQYDLSEPWTIGTAGYYPEKSVAVQEISPNGFYFRPDGNFLYVIGSTSDQIRRYELVVAWDISRQVNFVDSSLLTSASPFLEASPQSIYWKPDGLAFFYVGAAVDIVFEKSVTVPWTFQDEAGVANFPVTGETTPTGITFKADGTRMYIIGSSGADLVRQYDLSTAWSLSSVVAAGTFSVTTQDTNPQGVELSYDGTKLYMISLGGSVYEYTLTTAWDVTTATVNSSFLLTPYGSSWTEVRFKDDGTVMYVLGLGNDRMVQFNLATPWSITTATYATPKSLNVAPFDPTPAMLDFDSTGTKLYVGGGNVDTVFELDVLIPWEITSAVYLGDIRDLSTQDSNIGGVAFSSDGTKMFASGTATASIYSYSLSTAWEVSTAVYDRAKILPDLLTLTTVKFSAAGDKLFVLDQSASALTEYALSEAWDISTVTFTALFDLSTIEKLPVDVKFKTDGSEFYIVGLSRKVSAYDLTTPWSLADVAYKNSVNISSEARFPSGIEFSYNGDKMYVLDQLTATIYEYNLEQDWNIDNFTDIVGKIYWQFQNEIFVAARQVELNTWTHVAASRQIGVLRLFVNGELSGEFSDVRNYASTGEFRIGRGVLTSSDYFNGAISNFRLSLSSIYNNNFQPPAAPLSTQSITALLAINNRFSVTDSSVNNLTITASGGVTVSALSPFVYSPVLKPKLITYGGGGGNSGQTTVSSRSGGLAGGSGGGGQGESPWTTYNTGTGGDGLQAVRLGHFANTFDLESRLVIANNNLFDFSYNIDYTIETWFYLDGNSPTTGLGFRRATIISGIAEAAGSTNSFEFLINGTGTVTGTGLYVGLRNNSTTLIEYNYPVTIEKYKWHHAAFSKKENVMSVYLNGVRVGQSTDFSMKTAPGPNPIKIASVFSSGTGFQPLIGKLSNLRVSRGLARYQGESFTLPAAPFTDDTYTILLTCQSEDFKDNSKNQLSIARTGSVRVTSSITPFVKKTLFSAAFKNNAYLRVDSAISSFTTAAQPWTIECWLNESQQAAVAYFIGINSIASGANDLLVRNNAIIVGATTYTFSESFTTGRWNHFAMTYNGTALRIYKNGVSVLNQITALPALYLSVFGIATEFDAANGGTPGDYYTGYIHDFRVVSSVVYTENFVPPSTLLVDIPGTTLLCLRSDQLIDDSGAKCPISIFNNVGIENVYPYSTTLDQYQAVTELTTVLDPSYGSMEFNGDLTYVDAASNFVIGINDFTIEFWCKFTNATIDGSNSRRILSQGVNSTTSVQIYVAETNRTINGRVVPRGTVSFFTTADVISAVKRADDDKWHHIAFSRQGTTLRSFYDGELMDTVTNNTNFTSSLGYRIGTYAGFASQGNYQGQLSNIRISLFTARYIETFTPLLDNFPLVFGYIDFQIETKLLIQGQTVLDQSVNGYLLTAAGALATNEDSPFLQTQVVVPRNFKLAIKSYGNSGGITVTGTTQIGGAGGGGAGAPGNDSIGVDGGGGGDGILIPLDGNFYGGGGGGGNNNDTLTIVSGGLGGGGDGSGFQSEDDSVITTSAVAVGGTTLIIEQSGQLYRVHVFNSSEVFRVNAALSVEYLIVAGGGGSGGVVHDGGGGAGGMITGVTTLGAGENYFVAIGGGGSGSTNGGSSTFAGINATGGGRGDISFNANAAAGNGGSGGGAGLYAVDSGNQGTGISGQGFDGGGAGMYANSGSVRGGGGGGADAPGVAGNADVSIRGFGGAGRLSNITGVDIYYAGGGGGASWSGSTAGVALGGIGGGGNGGRQDSTLAQNGQANTGGGAGARYQQLNVGGSGVVIIKYAIPENEELNNFTYTVSVPQINAQPNTGGGGGGSTGLVLGGGNGGSGIIKIAYKSRNPIAVKNTDFNLLSGIDISIIPVSVSGPGTSYTFSINPTLPTGLNFNTSTGRITGSTTQLTDTVYTVTITDSADSTLQDFNTFRLVVERGNQVIGGQELIYGDGEIVYRVHKITESSNLVFTGPGPFECYIIGGGGAGGGGSGTADGSGGGGSGGYVIAVKKFNTNEKTPTTVYADVNTEDQGWSEGTDYTGNTGIVSFVKEVTTTTNQISSGGARTIELPAINGYVELKINQHSNVNIGVCKISSGGGLDNIPSINLSNGNLAGTSSSTKSLSRFIKSDILQILFDDTGRVYFGKNNVWSNRYQTLDGDLAPGTGNLQIVILANQSSESTAILDAEFLKREDHTYAPPTGYLALGVSIVTAPVIIGAGAAGRVAFGLNGSDSSIFDTVALGGGGGAAFDTVGIAGGSGGGGGGRNTRAGGAALQPTSISGGYGSAGGSAAPTSVAGSNAGGGGGGIPAVTAEFSSRVAFGGETTVIQQGDVFYRVHVFKSTSIFETRADLSIEYLVVGGGGGGGDRHGGGGGGGGYRTADNFAVTSGSLITVVVGAGGAGGNYEASNSSPSGSGLAGSASTLATITSNGGGGGGTFDGNPTGTFGSGGGGGGNTLPGIAGTGGQGNNGGSGLFPGGGGGGGAGGVGGNANNGSGGIGLASSISGVETYYAGGGGGAWAAAGGPATPGGTGGGGGGAWGEDTIQAGSANTGGGGGGTRANPEGSSGRPGGSGIVIIKYQIPAGESLNNFTYINVTQFSPGANAGSGSGGAGGNGITLFDGTVYGAGGGAPGQTTSGLGGSLYAGDGARSAGLVGASSGIVNTGSGGGGSWASTTNDGLGGSGGSGVVFIKYRIT